MKKTSAVNLEAKMKKTLRKIFGLREFRPGQAEVIRSVLNRQDTIAIFPTGAGKSLCYQLPALLTTGTAIVVSPLISLMKDQKDKLDELDVPSVILNSSVSQSDQKESLVAIKRGETEFIYVTPERLQTPEFVQSIGKTKIDLLVIDEAHCITQWGHDFRPAYLGISEVRGKLGGPPVLALTATATPEVIDDIRVQLHLKDPVIVSTSVMRKNLSYAAFVTESEEEKRLRLLNSLKSRAADGTTIVYSATIKGVNELSDYLKSEGIESTTYHGRLPSKEKSRNQDAFISGNVRTMVATTAFGMGIDKADVREVIHFNFPGSLETYYQESGRAGRDGLPSTCILYYLKKDKSLQSLFKGGKFPNETQIMKFCAVVRSMNGSLVTEDIAEQAKLPKTKTVVLLQALSDLEIIGKGKMFKRPLDEKDEKTLITMFNALKQADEEKLRQMVIYSQTALCRWKVIMKYFGEEPDFATCGHCDNCTHPLAAEAV